LIHERYRRLLASALVLLLALACSPIVAASVADGSSLPALLLSDDGQPEDDRLCGGRGGSDGDPDLAAQTVRRSLEPIIDCRSRWRETLPPTALGRAGGHPATGPPSR
jgi:hypothetical protein